MQLGSSPSFLAILLLLFVSPGSGLTPEERSELARKFKYYHASVRPADKFNLIETLNGTFFNLNTEIELLQTRPNAGAIELEMVMIVHYLDDRLIMRELDDVLTIPNEFDSWTPNIDTSPNLDPQKSVHVDPKTGQMTMFIRINSRIPCYSEIWKHPFESFQCDLSFDTEQDERIFVRTMRDLRPDNQISSIGYRTEEWPHMVFHLSFSSQWHSSIVNTYLPTILIFSVFIFAQWKRRKVQILVGVSALISIIILQTSQRKHDQITMQDLWMSGILLHLIAILTVDLVLPARRIVQTTISSNEQPSQQQMLAFASPSARRFRKYSSEQDPLLNYSPSVERGQKTNGQSVYAYIGPAGLETNTKPPAPLVKGDSESDALTDVYLYRNPRTTPVRRQITETTIGRKKKLALGVILVFYALFILSYTALSFFVLTMD
ncbi:hypothetical protein FO519_000533 [Halicephalobus sp. NKZ332]|nr:hypothetical protein FO519_000533 [Halicephalobus sp. NKZ332]